MKILVTCTVNGAEHAVLADSRDTLLELLRERLRLTGTKEGCSNGNCGTCTVLMDGAPVNACLVLALEVPGCAITTIEGVSDGAALTPIQQALVDHGGTQ
jgi:aerobic-type carbon monoxide dehydrogenase small subunit (CoxS/CutS family)